jgi:hypothetical protein
MSKKIMISIPDDLNALIEEYNRTHRFRKLQVSGICSEALYNAVTGIENCSENTVHTELSIKPIEQKHILVEETAKSAICLTCQEEFIKNSGKQKYCSDKCRTNAHYHKKKSQSN